MNKKKQKEILQVLKLSEQGCGVLNCTDCLFYENYKEEYSVSNPCDRTCSVVKTYWDDLKKYYISKRQYKKSYGNRTNNYSHLQACVKIKANEKLNDYDPVDVFEVKLLRNI